jgi:hypothetical protein
VWRADGREREEFCRGVAECREEVSESLEGAEKRYADREETPERLVGLCRGELCWPPLTEEAEGVSGADFFLVILLEGVAEGGRSLEEGGEVREGGARTAGVGEVAWRSEGREREWWEW